MGKADTIAEVYVDWGDRADPDPVGGARVFGQIGGRSAGLPAPVIHDYPAIVGPEGLRAMARAAVVAVGSSPPPPGTPIEERLVPLKPLLVLPYGIVLDPPPPLLRIVTPAAGDIVPALTEVRLEMDSITADVHLLGADQSDRSIYHHLGYLPAPRAAKHAGARVVDTARLGEEGFFDVVAVSTNEIDAAVGAAVPWYDIPPASPFTAIELRHAGVIVAPTSGAVVSEVGIEPVRAKVLLPDRYAVVAVRPLKEGRYWIQNDPLAVTPSVEFSVQASFGGLDRYDIWLGITEDPHLTKAGDRLEQLGRTDPGGRPVHWVGPVEVSREDR